MRTLKEIMTTISCNGMREWTDERVAQAMMEYAHEIKRRYRIRVNIYFLLAFLTMTVDLIYTIYNYYKK